VPASEVFSVLRLGVTSNTLRLFRLRNGCRFGARIHQQLPRKFFDAHLNPWSVLVVTLPDAEVLDLPVVEPQDARAGVQEGLDVVYVVFAPVGPPERNFSP